MDEFDKRGGLAWAEAMGTEVAHEADPDRNFVESFTGEVSALFLLEPAGADFDLAVA